MPLSVKLPSNSNISIKNNYYTQGGGTDSMRIEEALERGVEKAG
jgi:predicted patatin/cPLA2 family phospholipase